MLFLYGLFSWIVVVAIGLVAWAVPRGNSFHIGAYAIGAAAGIYFVIFANRKTFRDVEGRHRDG